MTHRGLAKSLRRPLMAFMVMMAVNAPLGTGQAAEGLNSISRKDLVAAVERGPGPMKGAADAPVIMVEFSDFLCGYCRLFWKETLPKIEDRYILTGKVRFVYRHMTIRGEASVLAGQAASCAHEQGKFWQYHDMLWDKGFSLALTSARLKRYAAELGLDEKRFASCLDSGKQAERVETETIFGRALGANGTPSFLVNGQLVIGAYPFEFFQRGLDGLLTKTPRELSGQAK